MERARDSSEADARHHQHCCQRVWPLVSAVIMLGPCTEAGLYCPPPPPRVIFATNEVVTLALLAPFPSGPTPYTRALGGRPRSPGSGKLPARFEVQLYPMTVGLKKIALFQPHVTQA